MLMRRIPPRTSHPSIILLFVLILTLGGLTACSRDSGETQRVYRLGERVEAGSLIFTVVNAEWVAQLGEHPTQRAPNHRFLLVRLSVTNSGGSKSTIPTLNLVDSSGESHAELTDGTGVPEWMGVLRSLQPAATEHGRVVFDVPMGAYKLRVSSDDLLSDQETALVEIPLDLGDPVPVPPPPTVD